MRSGATSNDEVTGVVLAGGRSTRFGRDKLMEEVRGRPLVHHALNAVASVAGQILVSVSADGAVPLLPEDVGVVLVRDELDDEGPLSGLATALKYVDTPLAVVVGGDMPSLSADVLLHMVEVAAADEDAEVVALADGEVVRPLPCVLRTRVALRIGDSVGSGERRLRFLLDLSVHAIPEEEWRAFDRKGGTLLDVDRPEDLDDEDHL